jgi:D-alanine-D-alanine ligase
MRVAVLHNAVAADAPADEQDVLVQVAAVEAALADLGHQARVMAVSLDLEQLRRWLGETKPDVVFNLVESLAGQDRLMFMPTALLDALGLPYTGAPTEAIFFSGDKLLAKQRLGGAGLPTPDWIAAVGWDSVPTNFDSASTGSGQSPKLRYVIKSAWQHASFGLDEESLVCDPSVEQLRARLAGERRVGPWFAERFIDGREFNLSLLGGDGGVQVLPPAEIDFSSFPAGKPRLVGHRAKWQAGTFEYQNTPRTFDFPAGDGPLLNELARLAEQCWAVFGLGGYARVDFRVDRQGRPWILEINANPCLSPDAGFAAALARAEIAFPAAVERILDGAINRTQRRPLHD